MASTLDGGERKDRVLNKGHGTGALGPSDTSDSGSDVMGGPGLIEGDMIGLDRGTNEDPEAGGRIPIAGPDLGDADLDSDSDSSGTGERQTAGRDPERRADSDVDIDRIGRVRDDRTAGS